MDSTDLVIGDVLNKMPGIEVRDNGEIKYQGKAISKLYIENMDMLQGRYGIATNNISASDIATVQVLENHQPIKALQDIAFSDDVAINLKLKPDAKGIYTAMADIGIGLDTNLLWNSSVTGMYFGKTRQHLIALKSNNTGNDLDNEFQSFYQDDRQVSRALSSIIMPTPPNINKNKYYFNQAMGGTINNLFKTKNDAEWTINLNGFDDNDNRRSYARTNYFIPGGDTITISEKMNSHTDLLKMGGSIGYNLNKKNDYLNLRFLFSGNTNKSSGNIITNEHIVQKDSYKPLKLASNIHWTKRGNTNQNGIEFNSRTFYQLQPSCLEVSPGVYSNELNDSILFSSIKQNVNFRSFETKNNLLFIKSTKWKSIFITPAILTSFEQQSLNTQLSTLQNGNGFYKLTDNSSQNNLEWMRLKMGLSLRISYKKRDFSFVFSTPVQYQHISLNDHIKDSDLQRDKIIFRPLLNLHYYVNPKLDFFS